MRAKPEQRTPDDDAVVPQVYVINFGKHRGLTLQQVRTADPEYLQKAVDMVQSMGEDSVSQNMLNMVNQAVGTWPEIVSHTEQEMVTEESRPNSLPTLKCLEQIHSTDGTILMITHRWSP